MNSLADRFKQEFNPPPPPLKPWYARRTLEGVGSPIRAKCRQCKHCYSINHNAHVGCLSKTAEVIGSQHGYQNGWFNWPFNFDPIWIMGKCTGYEKGENSIQQYDEVRDLETHEYHTIYKGARYNLLENDSYSVYGVYYIYIGNKYFMVKDPKPGYVSIISGGRYQYGWNTQYKFYLGPEKPLYPADFDKIDWPTF